MNMNLWIKPTIFSFSNEKQFRNRLGLSNLPQIRLKERKVSVPYGLVEENDNTEKEKLCIEVTGRGKNSLSEIKNSFLLEQTRKKILIGKHILNGFLNLLGTLIATGLCGYFGWKILLSIYPNYNDILQGFTYNGHYYIAAFSFLFQFEYGNFKFESNHCTIISLAID